MQTVRVLALILSAFLLPLPLTGRPDARVLGPIDQLPGVASARFHEGQLFLEVESQARVSVSSIQGILTSLGSETQIDLDRIPVTRHVLFQVNAGQCFNCFQVPMRKSFEREEWVQSWNVVDYAPRGRFLFRIEARFETRVDSLSGTEIEEIWLSDRYAELDEIDLNWPAAGVAWRTDEESAVAEARRSQKPLLIFPTAGT